MAEVKTVDQLGIGPSARYARDQAALQGKVIQDAHISKWVEIPVFTPYRPTEFEKYEATNERAAWASFSAPPDTFRSLPRWDAPQTDKLEELSAPKALIQCGKKLDEIHQMKNRITGRRSEYTKG